MKQIKEERSILIYVNITYSIVENKLIQKFSFTTKRKQDLSYLYDARYLMKKEIDKLIESNLLNGFLERVDCKDYVEITYSELEHPAPIIKVISTYMPPCAGCLYCEKAEEQGEFIYCPEKNKHYLKANAIKRCPVFRCKDKIIT